MTPSPWDDAVLAAALFAVDPVGTGGIVLRAGAGPVRDAFLAAMTDLLPAGTPVRRMPANIPDGRLVGGLDLAATLRAGRPVAERGLLADADGGVVIAAMAERLPTATAAKLAAVMEAREVVLERDGLATRAPARIGVVALDEGLDRDEVPPLVLADRLAFCVALDPVTPRDVGEVPFTGDQIALARARLPAIVPGEGVVEALCGASAALGIASLRTAILALAVARAAAALGGREVAGDEDAALAARLVLAPRATRLPLPPEEEAAPPPPPEPPETSGESDPDKDKVPDDRPLEDVVLEAAKAAIPAGLLALLQTGALGRPRGGDDGRGGAPRTALHRGRPVGTRRGRARPRRAPRRRRDAACRRALAAAAPARSPGS